jgi:cell division protein FtsB
VKKAFSHIISHTPMVLRNKYVLTITAFIIWMAFFDQNNLISTIRLRMQLSELRKQEQYYREELKKTEALRHAIFHKDENLEKFAREKFFMKKENEVLYVIVEE